MKKKRNNSYSSFRDPSGYVYVKNNNVYRKIFPCYFKQYDYFMNSGLYEELVKNNFLIEHEEIKRTHDFFVLKPKKIAFISYPYEWCFDELKDAALLTLNILKISLKYNMILKDASAYNVQFLGCMPVFIDTLSFDFYEEGSAWLGYGQFCRHFMAPLLLMSYVDMRSNLLLKDFIDGIPLDFCNHLLKGRGGMPARMHIKWHSKSISKYDDVISKKENKMSKQSLMNMIDMMIRQIRRLSLKKELTEWDCYYDNTNYDDVSTNSKINYVKKYLEEIPLDNKAIFDIGANDGKYSMLAIEKSEMVVSFDNDYNCVNRNYCVNKSKRETHLLPLVLDFSNPSSGIGFAGLERDSLMDRSNVSCVMALAVIHHVCISNNVSFDMLAGWLSSLGKYLIIEFVPKDDSKVMKLLSTRKDIFDWYHIDEFEEVFSDYYEILKKNKIKNSKRVLYLMRRKSSE